MHAEGGLIPFLVIGERAYFTYLICQENVGRLIRHKSIGKLILSKFVNDRMTGGVKLPCFQCRNGLHWELITLCL